MLGQPIRLPGVRPAPPKIHLAGVFLSGAREVQPFVAAGTAHLVAAETADEWNTALAATN